jgi:hypothetical protein
MLTPVPSLIYGALAEIRVARGGDVVRADDQALCLTFLNEVLERLAVTPHALYGEVPAGFTLTPGLAIQSLGPTGVLEYPRRPVRILQAAIGLVGGGAQLLDGPQSVEWWVAQGIPQRLSGIPTGFHYNPLWPNGEIGLDPVPLAAHPITLRLETEILAVDDMDSIDLPVGYSELLRLWTAKKAAPAFAREFSAASQAALTECLGEVFGTNIPRVNDADTRDGGVPGGRGGTYDYRTGLVT